MPESPELHRSSALATFEFLAGPQAGETLPVLAPAITIGQGPQNDIVLGDDSVSRIHARLEFIVAGWHLTDLESTNGTAIDGVRLQPGIPAPLRYGSEMRFGGVQVAFYEVPDSNPAAARTSVPQPPVSEPWRFRLPVWLFLLILIVLALVAFFLLGGADSGAALP